MSARHEFREVAKTLNLQSLHQKFYNLAVRLDGKNLPFPGFAEAGQAMNSDYNGAVRIDRMGKYQKDDDIVLFCNENAEIYAARTKDTGMDYILKLLEKHGYRKEDSRNELWVDNGIYNAFFNNKLNDEIGEKLFRPASAAEAKPVQ